MIQIKDIDLFIIFIPNYSVYVWYEFFLCSLADIFLKLQTVAIKDQRRIFPNFTALAESFGFFAVDLSYQDIFILPVVLSHTLPRVKYFVAVVAPRMKFCKILNMKSYNFLNHITILCKI